MSALAIGACSHPLPPVDAQVARVVALCVGECPVTLSVADEGQVSGRQEEAPRVE